MGTLKKVLLLSYICIASISSAIITPALPLIQQEFVLNTGALQWVVSVFLIGYVFGQLVYGPAANRFGRIRALRVGLLLHMLGLIVCLYASNVLDFQYLLLGRLLSALGSAAGLACTFMLINELLSESQAKQAMSYSVLSFTVGVGAAITLGGVISEYWHWRGCFVFLLVHAGVMLFGLRYFPETLKHPVSLQPKKIIAGYKAALVSPTLVIFALAVSLVSSVGYCFTAGMPAYAQQFLHLSTAEYSYWSLLNTTGMLLSGLISARIIRKHGPGYAMALGLVCTLPCLISLMLINWSHQAHPLWFFSTTMLLHLFVGFVFPSASFYASNAIADRGSASSMMSFINMGSATTWVIVMGHLGLRPLSAFLVTIGTFYCLVVVLLLAYFAKTLTKNHANSGHTTIHSP